MPNNATKTEACALIKKNILHYGIPQEIATNIGTDFISATMEDIWKLLEIKQI